MVKEIAGDVTTVVFQKGHEGYEKIKRILLKVAATVLALLLTITVLLQELIQQSLKKISEQEKKLKQTDKTK